MRTEVDPQELQRFEQTLNSYVSTMEHLVQKTSKSIDDMAGQCIGDAAIAAVARDIKATCKDVDASLQELKTGPVKTIGQKVKKFVNPPTEFKGKFR